MAGKATVVIRGPLDRAPWMVPDLIEELAAEGIEAQMVERVTESRSGVPGPDIGSFIQLVMDASEWGAKAIGASLGAKLGVNLADGATDAARRWIAKRRKGEPPRKIEVLLGPQGQVIARVESPQNEED